MNRENHVMKREKTVMKRKMPGEKSLDEMLKSLDYFRIYNRRGNLVFETRNVNESWDGTKDNKPLGMDTYYYVLEGTCPDGAVVFKKGDVVLMR